MKSLAPAVLLLATTQAYARVAPIICPNGQPGETVLFDGLENGDGAFSRDFGPFAGTINGGGLGHAIGQTVWELSTVNPNSGAQHLDAFPRVSQITRSPIAIDITLPGGEGYTYYVQFRHLFNFESGGPNGQFLDGGFIFYRIVTTGIPGVSDGVFGANTDAGDLITGGQLYNGRMSFNTDNPSAGHPGFVGKSNGYTITRLDLSSLNLDLAPEGSTFTLGFIFTSDSIGPSLGWQIDDIHFYRCEGVIAQPPPVKCNGVNATLVGTNRKDNLRGTSVRDVIAGLGGNDKLSGNEGNDLICGGKGKDTCFGGTGRDTFNKCESRKP